MGADKRSRCVTPIKKPGHGPVFYYPTDYSALITACCSISFAFAS